MRRLPRRLTQISRLSKQGSETRLSKIVNKCDDLSICSITEDESESSSFELVLDKRLISSMHESYDRDRVSRDSDSASFDQKATGTLHMTLD